MTIFVPGKVTLRQTWQPMDPDAAAYITAVETADGQALEEKVKIAIDNFVLGCKADGIWSAIKASCILAGARTLNGALVPLVGTAPTNYNFVAGDYNRETGLVGNGSTKYLDSGRTNNADPQDSHHLSVYKTTAGSGTYIGAPDSQVGSGAVRSRNSTLTSVSTAANLGFLGVNRNNPSDFAYRVGGANFTSSLVSQAAGTNVVSVFSYGGATAYSDARLAFYSIGESLDLARLDARVTDLINAIGVAIP